MKLILQLLLVGLINLHVKSAMVSCRQKNKHAAGVPFLLETAGSNWGQDEK